MVAHINTFAFNGIDVEDIDVQVHFASGLPSFKIVGLPDKAVSESKERIRAAISAMGLSLPPKRITINLSPADIGKEGSHYDLPIALGLLIKSKILSEHCFDNFIAMGELSLDGSITAVNGVLPAAIGAVARGKNIICPKNNGKEASLAGNLEILAASNLFNIINHFKGTQIISPPDKNFDIEKPKYPNLKDVKGQESAKRALEIAAAGGHNMLMIGPPGSGKSMLAQRLPGILPDLDTKEMLEVSVINSISGNISSGNFNFSRPFRSPHHNCSMPAMVGGGSKVKPGEVTLAHKGVLFLDELAEFPAPVLESLRQPLETKDISIARVQSHVTYPANFQLITAMNPCRCGYLHDPERACHKAPKCATDYQAKISGPLLDRIDIHIEVNEQNPHEAMQKSNGEDSKKIKERVSQARNLQKERYKDYEFNINAEISGANIKEIVLLSEDAEGFLEKNSAKLNLSMRGFNRLLKLARTIADIDKTKNIEKNHIAEAVSYRRAFYKNS